MRGGHGITMSSILPGNDARSFLRLGSTMANGTEIKWLPDPEDHDYLAAGSYLRLLYDDASAGGYVDQLRNTDISTFMAKDIFRASGLSLLGTSNSHVEHERAKILAGQSLAPLLLVRAKSNQEVVIADGYHRMCAVYSFDENAPIPCKIV
jgi:hypothetical protein